MAKQPAIFKTYPLDCRKRLQPIPGSAARISQYRLRAGDWRVSKPAAKPQKTKKRAASKKVTTTATKAIKRPADLLKSSEDSVCLHCGCFSKDPSSACRGTTCVRAFRKQHFSRSVAEIRGPSGTTGYGAFAKPGSSIAKGDYLGEYIGELHQLGTRNESLYRLDIPGVCPIDAEAAGNWCRFINSSCRPNVRCFADFVGGWHVVLFEALRDIAGGEELTFNYGRKYFAGAGFECRCTEVKGPHLPSGGRGKPRK